MAAREGRAPDRRGRSIERAQQTLLLVAVVAAVALLLTMGIVGARRRPGRLQPQPTASAGAVLPPLPPGWPSTLQLGVADSPGGAAAMRAVAPFGLRYQYLAGGVNTGNGWSTWDPDGQFVTSYIRESLDNGVVPVFTYYMIVQSSPGNAQGEADGVSQNLQDASTMAAYYNDLRLFFQRAGAFAGRTAVLHVEPDLWGFIEQRATEDDASTVPVQVASTGVGDVAGLPDTASGLARAIVRLRDAYAPNVLLAYHLSVWGTGDNLLYSDPPNATVDAEASRAGAFYKSLGAAFDLAFTDASDRDAGFYQYIYGDGGAAWWDAGDYARNVRFLAKFTAVTGKRVVVWQIPYGNTKMRAMDNTWDHFQDNHVEWLLDDPARARLIDYVNAGVIGFLFGRGADGATCNCDAAGDGLTDPAPVNGNTVVSLSADDDGGFFDQKAAAYYATGALPLTAAPIATPAPSRTATRTPTPTRTPSPTPDAGIPRGETVVPLP